MNHSKTTPDEEGFDRRLAALSPEVSPPARVWNDVRRAIDKPNLTGTAKPAPVRRRLERESMWAASLAGIAAALTVVIILVNNAEPMPAPDLAAEHAEPFGFAAVRAFEVEGMDSAELMRVRRDLHQSLLLALDELAPETRNTVVENLARIDTARTQIDDALRDDPANQLLQQILLSSYTHEITLLNEFTRMARSAPQRTQL